jgi:hypothetical protein
MAKSIIDHAQQLNIRWRIAIGVAVVLLILFFTSPGLEVGSDVPYPSELKSSSLLGKLKDLSPASDWITSSVPSSSVVSIILISFD